MNKGCQVCVAGCNKTFADLLGIPPRPMGGWEFLCNMVPLRTSCSRLVTSW